MSYNGVGLSTPRGTGTNGHIQRNWSHLRARDVLTPRDGSGAFSSSSSFGGASTGLASRAPDAAILDHERRRRVEVQCLELQVRLEEQEGPALSEQEIEQQVDALRQRLLVQSQEAQGKERKGLIQPHERHELAQAKAFEDEKLRKALGISKDHVEGRAFDRVEQERLKEARKAEWERKEEDKRSRQEERVKHQQELERLKQQHELEKSRLKRDYERRGGAPPAGASFELPLPLRPIARRSTTDRRRYSRSPEVSGRRWKDSRSISPPPRRRGRSPSRSPSRSRSRSRSRSCSRSYLRSCSPPPRRSVAAGSSAKGRGRSPSRSVSRSRSPMSCSPSPRRSRTAEATGAKRPRSPSRSRSRSPRSRSASMSISSLSSTPPRSKARND